MNAQAQGIFAQSGIQGTPEGGPLATDAVALGVWGMGTALRAFEVWGMGFYNRTEGAKFRPKGL